MVRSDCSSIRTDCSARSGGLSTACVIHVLQCGVVDNEQHPEVALGGYIHITPAGSIGNTHSG